MSGVREVVRKAGGPLPTLFGHYGPGSQVRFHGRRPPVSTAIEFWSNVGVENSPLQFDLVAPVAAGRLNGGEFAEVEFDHVLERLCRGSLAEAVG